MGAERHSEWPGAATTSETVKGFEAPAEWTGLSGAAKLPRAPVRQTYKEVWICLANAAVKAKLAAIGIQPRAVTPDEFAAKTTRQQALIGKVVETAGIKAVD